MFDPIPPKPFKAPVAVPPGFTIQEMLEDAGITQDEFAARMEFSRETVDYLIKGNVPITSEIAEKLSEIIGLSKKYWLNREVSYQEAITDLCRE